MPYTLVVKYETLISRMASEIQQFEGDAALEQFGEALKRVSAFVEKGAK